MRKFMILIVLAITILASSTLAQTLHVIGGPAQADEAMVKEMLHCSVAIGVAAKAGDEFRFIEAYTNRPLAAFRVPESKTKTARIKAIAKHLVPIRAYYQTARTEMPPHSIHLPNFLDSIAQTVSALDREFAQTKILVCGSSFFGNGTDSRYDFSAGQYPSPGHVAAVRRLSVFGTVDARPLPNTRLDWLNLTPIADDGDRLAIQTHWTLYCQRRSIVLTSWQTARKAALENVLGNPKEPIVKVVFDPNDLRREIRRVDGTDLLPNVWTLVFIVDASASMQHAFDQIQAEIPVLAERAYEAGATIRVAVVPFREEPLPAFPLSAIRSRESDGGKSIARLTGFLQGVTPTSSRVDPNAALRAGMALVDADRHRPTYTQIILVGDTTSEVNADAGRRARLAADLEAWVDQAQGRTVRGIFVGQSSGSTTFDWLESIGDRPVVASVRALADSVVEQAANVTRGTTPR